MSFKELVVNILANISIRYLNFAKEDWNFFA